MQSVQTYTPLGGKDPFYPGVSTEITSAKPQQNKQYTHGSSKSRNTTGMADPFGSSGDGEKILTMKQAHDSNIPAQVVYDIHECDHALPQKKDGGKPNIDITHSFKDGQWYTNTTAYF